MARQGSTPLMRLTKVYLLLASLALPAAAEYTTRGGRARRDGPRIFLAASNQDGFQDELRLAVHTALGAGRDLDRQMAATRAGLAPMWSALAKDGQGRIDGRSLRYAVHRYLMKTRSLSVKGLEPVFKKAGEPGAAESDSLEATLLTQFAPGQLKRHFDETATSGFSLDDAAAMVIMLEELVSHQSSATDGIYKNRAWHNGEPVSRDIFVGLLEDYLVRWLLAGDRESIRALERNHSLRNESFDGWPLLAQYVAGEERQYEYEHMHPATEKRSSKGNWNPLRESLTHKDFQEVTGRITLGFGKFWREECENIKTSLSKLQFGSTGRVPIGDFHGRALGGEWRFSESKEYLRELGALDESLEDLGPSVIISNYILGASNCIVSESHFRICCPSACEDYLSDIEAAVQAPFVTSEQLLAVVENLTTSLDDSTPQVSSTLRSQLDSIATLHGGKIPLHGRLFAQWLHYLFPTECPFPHKAGTVSSLTPSEYGDDFMASELELEKHSVLSETSAGAGNRTMETYNDHRWMSQWSHDEELLSARLHNHAPWSRGTTSNWMICTLLVAVAAAGAYFRGRARAGKGMEKTSSPVQLPWAKAHFV